MKKILITGANGFLGKGLLEKLAKDPNYEVFSLTRKKDYMRESYPEIVHYGTDDFNANQIPFEKIDVVVHCAFARGSSGVELSSSLEFTAELFGKIKNNIINISSRSVYGQNPAIPWRESTPVQPDQPYALAKFSAEQMLRLKCLQNFEGHATNIRLAGLVGAGFEDRVVNKFVDKVINRESIHIKGGQQMFSYLYIDDAIEGINALLKISPRSWDFIYNFGYIRSYNILEIAGVVNDVAKQFNQPVAEIIVDGSDSLVYAELDSSLFYCKCNWHPEYDMKYIVEKIFESKLMR